MTASEHLALCEGKRGGATAEERALCKELAEYEARCLRLVADLAVAEERDGEARTQAAIDGEAWEDMKARAEAAEEDVRILTEASRANEDMIERARGSVPVEKLEALAKGCEEMEHSLVHHESAKYYAAEIKDRLRALIAEAREEGKPLPEISEAQLYEAVRHKSIKDRMDAVSALFARVAPPASAGTEGPGLPVGYMWKSSPGQEWEDTHFSATLPEFSTATWFLEAVSNGYCTAVVPLYARVEGEKK